MRVALFGGSFDPIHRGHLAIATAAAQTFALDSVLFVPVGRQPLKPGPPSASFADRLAMVSLACDAQSSRDPSPCFAPSTLDGPHADGSPNYTVDALQTLARQMPGASLFLLLGADSFLDLPRWRSPDRILALAELIVVSRPGFTLDRAALALTPTQRARVHLLPTVHETVSATQLRARLQAGDPCPGLLPPAVSDYIRLHRLYLPPDAAPTKAVKPPNLKKSP